MNQPLLRTILAAILVTGSTVWSATITSGSMQQNYDDGGSGQPTFTTNIFLTGANFSITTTQHFSIFPNIMSCGLGPSCQTYNFSQTSSFSTATLPPLTVVYNGVTYTNGATPYVLDLTLIFSSSQVTVPLNGVPPNISATFNNVPFTAVGSFTLRSGGNVIVTDTLSGQGGAGGSSTAFGPGSSGGITYAFTAAPEPATFALVAGGLLRAGWRVRKRLARPGGIPGVGHD